MDLLSEFINYHKDDFWAHKGEVRRQNFVNKYTNEVILGLSQEEYNFAGKENTFCFRIQRGLALLSSMGNAFPAVFGVYVNLDHRVRLSRNLELMFGSDYAGALKYQKEQIVSLIIAGKEQDYRFIENSDVNQQFRFKILSVYSPDIYFPVCTRPTAEAYCKAFGIKYGSDTTMLDLVIALSTWSRNNLPKDWSLSYAMAFCDWLWKTNRVLESQPSYADSVISRKVTNYQSKVVPRTHTIPCTHSNTIANKGNTIEDYKKIFPKGCRVKHVSFGIGVVKKVDKGIVTVDFHRVGTQVLGAEACVVMGLLERI